MLHNARRSPTCDTVVWNISRHHASRTLTVSIEFLKIFFTIVQFSPIFTPALFVSSIFK